MVNGWKVTAIVFIILFTLETGLLIWAWNMGTEMIDNEYECAYNICEDYASYNYDDYENMCSCFENNEVVSQEYMGR